jgi:FlaA1/EpsC-like NDP-sugar epimerase
MGSRGSVIPFFLKKRHEGILPITDPEMTRFNISLEEGVSMVLWAIEKSLGGEILVPRIPSYRITDVAKAIGPDCEHPIVGIRPGEKVHEEMSTSSDSFTTVDLGPYFAILPTQADYSLERYCEAMGASPVEPGFSYNSGSNDRFIACLAAGLKPGDRLWTCPNTFVASANCGLYCGATVDFVDIDPIT